MAPAQYRALEPIPLGLYPNVPAGELVDTSLKLLSSAGEEEPVDFERLLALGVVEAVVSPQKPAPAPHETERPAKPARSKRSSPKS